MHLRKTLSFLLLFAGPLTAESVTTDAVGFNKVTCLANSDTIVGVPLRVQGSITSKLAGAPVINGDTATLTLAHNALPSLTKHYLKFKGGTRDGRWYDILTNPANTASSVTIDLNGDNLDGVLSDASVLIAEYWTLDTLFPPAQATNDPLTTGHAVVSSISYSSLARRTEILMPNLTTSGINLAPSSIHFISGTTTKTWTQAQTGGTFSPSCSTVLYPGNYFIIRHSSSVLHPTTFRSLGEVEVDSMSIPLATSATSKRDNQIAIPRPISLALSELGLAGTPAFISTASVSSLARRDELFVYNNDVAIKNRAPSAVYFVMGGNWYKMVNNVAVESNSDRIEAGYGIVIRKYKTSAGQTVFWDNLPTY